MNQIVRIMATLTTLLVLLEFGGDFNLLAQETNVELGVESSPEVQSREVINDAFGLGERLLFSLGWGFITAGQATLEVADTNTIGDHLCYRITSRTTSNSVVDKFYKVRDTIISQIDVDGIFSCYFFKSLNEGSYHSIREIYFDHVGGEAICHKDQDQVDTLSIEQFSHDLISAFYYVRTQTLEVGQTLHVPTISGNKKHLLEVRVLKRETVEVPAGEFRCLVVEPLLSATGIFRHEGRIRVWLTDDRLHMPVLMKSKVVVGSIYAELKEFRLGDMDW